MTTHSYVRIREIARGGMARVDLALRREGAFQRLYAIKRLRPELADDPEMRAMFVDEARLAGLLRHPNVVSVLDVGTDEEGPFLVMDFVEGIALSRVIQSVEDDGPVPLQLCAEIGAQIARGLHAAHELVAHDGTPLHLVHRDVSPSNILVGFDGLVRVADFGIAKALGQRSRTSTGLLKGKIGYMSPEQLQFREPDRRSDLFALGVLLYELATGKRLYKGQSAMDDARRILHEPPPDVAELRPDSPPALVELLFDLLAKDSDARPANARDVAEKLSAIRLDLLLDDEPIDLDAFVRERFSAEQVRSRAMVAEATGSTTTERAPVRSRARAAALVGTAVVVTSVAAGLLALGPESIRLSPRDGEAPRAPTSFHAAAASSSRPSQPIAPADSETRADASMPLAAAKAAPSTDAAGDPSRPSRTRRRIRREHGARSADAPAQAQTEHEDAIRMRRWQWP